MLIHLRELRIIIPYILMISYIIRIDFQCKYEKESE